MTTIKERQRQAQLFGASSQGRARALAGLG